MGNRFETHGDFSWTELMTRDVEAAKKFYGELLGWEMDDEPEYDVESKIYYQNGSLIDINNAWLWYMFEFAFRARIKTVLDVSDLDDFEKIYAQYVMTPSSQIPLTGAAALPEAVADPDMAQMVIYENPADGGFDSGFSEGFDLYLG